MSKPQKDAAGEAVSNETKPSTMADVQPATPQSQAQSVVSLGLSNDLYDRLSLELRRALHAVEMQWDILHKPTDIAKRGDLFYVIDGLVIDDYINKQNGEQVTKCVFVLEFEDGHIEYVMQSAQRQRVALAKSVETARIMGGTYRAGPYRFVPYRSAGNTTPNDAIIFEKQLGWRQLIS